MGGAAFNHDGLQTPRIPLAVYRRVLSDTIARLSPHFHKVTFATDAPEKLDHGDIDILAVAHQLQKPSVEEIARSINAVRYYHAPNGVSQFAIPWPTAQSTMDDLNEGMNGLNATGSQDEEAKIPARQIVKHRVKVHTEKWIQVDLTICASQADLHWALFAGGHGDALNIIASIIRPTGLSLTSHALYLRIPGLDTKNKKLTRIQASRNPTQVLEFLGLDPDRFWEPFETRDELMTYIATCRFCDLARLYEERETKRANTDEAATKQRDKASLYQRPLFRYWDETFIPAHKHNPPGTAAHMTRDAVEQEVFQVFGPEIRVQFDTVKHEVSTSLGREKLWSDVQKHIANNEPRASAADLHARMRAIRREIVPPAGASAANPELSDVQKAYLINEWITVYGWATANYIAAHDRWKAVVAQSGRPAVIDANKTNKYSMSEAETFSEEDDQVISSMKAQDASWTEILTALNKKSKSQLMAHWKKHLQASASDTINV